jgi:hypothetical protein
VTGLEVWFAWKTNPGVELHAGSPTTASAADDLKAKLETNPDVQQATVYRVDADGKRKKL